MQISVIDPVFQTHLFIAVLSLVLLFSLRKREAGDIGSKTTQELKGFAIVAILIAHVGYYLSRDTQFLFPYSILAGVAVDLFLFLSGFGLAASAFSKELPPFSFYRRRLLKIFIPLWLTLAFFFLADFLFLGKTYGVLYLLKSMLGIFTQANLFSDINSPLWYITLILFYYLVFPVLFSRRYPYYSALGLYLLTLTIMWWYPGWFFWVLPLYQIHLMAFPLGLVGAALVRHTKRLPDIRLTVLNYAVLATLALGIAYFAYNSGVGKNHWIAEGISILTLFLVLAFFVLKRLEVRLFSLFGAVSFEIYLLHWPILYRYDILFKYLPAGIAMLAYLALFLALGWGLQKIIKTIDTRSV